MAIDPLAPAALRKLGVEVRWWLNQSLDAVDLQRVSAGDFAVVAVAAAGEDVADDSLQNQDSAAALQLPGKRLLLMVADGMGGGPSGAQASAAAIQAVVSAVVMAEANGLPLRSGVLDGFEAAQQQVQTVATGAGTTLLVVEWQEGMIRSYHAGDSAAYLFGRGGRVKLATDFHSPVGYGMKAGLLTERQAMSHAERHLVSNIVGLPGMVVEIGSPIEMARHDTLLLGSDGLYDNLFPNELVERLRKGPLADGVAAVRDLARLRMRNPERATPSKLDDLVLIGYRQPA